MKLFTKSIDRQLFDQYKFGSNLENQMVVAKIFNPYGRGIYYLLNSDEQDPDYLWAIVDLFEVETGSVSRSELESIKVPPFGLGLERDLYFTPINAKVLYDGLLSGKHYAEGGETDNGNLEMLRSNNKAIRHHTEELENELKGKPSIEAWVVAKGERAATDLSDITHYLDGKKKIDSSSMADGGMMAKGGEIEDKFKGKNSKEIWNSLDSSTKAKVLEHLFIKGNTSGVQYYDSYNSLNELSYSEWDKLPKNIKNEIDNFGQKDKMAHGGVLEGLSADIYRSQYDSPTNKLYGKKGVIIVDKEVPKIFDADESTPAVRLVRRKFSWGDYIHAIPYDQPEGRGMFGGTFIYSSDSRFPSKYPIPLHDRVEMEKGGYMADGGELDWGADLGNGITIGMDVYITDSKSMFKGKTGFVSGLVGKDLLVTISENGNDRNVVVSKKGIERLDAPEFAKGGDLDESAMIYNMADKMTNLEFQNNLSKLNKDQKRTYESLVRLGDSPKLAIATVLLQKENKWDDDTIKAYTMAMGGETTFSDKVKAVKSTLLKNKKVSPKVQKDYGKTYSPKEALASAKRIIGSRVAKYKK